MEYDLFVLEHYAAYVEFGTGGLVDIPKGLESYAIQFKGLGIRQVNLPARPYFFPALFSEEKKFMADLRDNLLKESFKGITVIRPGKSNIISVTTI